jgi:NitT/TauT family transport system permease protein
MGTFSIVRKLLDPYIEFFRYIPALSLVTLALIWFGPGEASKVFLLTYATLFIVVVNTAVGVGAVPTSQIRAAQSLGARRHQVFLHVIVPRTVPYILTGMRIALGNAFTTIVASEMVAAQSGLGFVIFSSRLFMNTQAIFVAIFCLGLLGLASDRLLRTLMRVFARRYVRQASLA